MTSLERVCACLRNAKIRYAVCGGHAVALHGAVRGTIDIDIVLAWNRKTLRAASEALGSIGLSSRLPISADDLFDFRDEYIRNRNLVAWNFYNPADLAEQVDIVITHDLKGMRTTQIELSSGPISVLSKSDLIRMKRDSGRPQDIEDATALEKLP